MSNMPSITINHPSRVCLNSLHAAWYGNMQAKFFYILGKVQGAYMKTLCRITMQLPQFQLKLKTFPLLLRHDYFVFALKLPK